MDFFEGQRAARRRTAWLLLAWLLALPGVVGLVYLAALATAAVGLHRPVALWTPELFWGCAVAVAVVVAAGTAYHVAVLARGGGDEVARSLGGELLGPAPRDDAERRLRNVVEEMAIAAGLPVPRIYVLRREGAINAFAAGLAPNRAVVAVTQGALEKLSRDELQGVVAHELSHVLNGDMVLNLRLMALVGGLTVIALVGRELLALGWGSGERGRWTRRSRGGGLLLVAGGLLLAAGSAGVLFGRLIQAAVSRTREVLADASAVRFTRAPDGLAGALRKIAAEGSAVASPRAADASHLFFAGALAGGLSRLLATHPPIAERLALLEPGASAPRSHAAPAPAGELAASARLAPAALVASAGAPGPEHVAWARDLLAALPPALAAAAREPFGARALACALLLDRRPEVRELQLAAVEGPHAAELRRLAPLVDAVGRPNRLALLELGLPALAGLSAAQRAALLEDLRRIADADGRVTLSEWVLLRVVRRHVGALAGARPPRPRFAAVEQVEVECLEVLSLLAWAGSRDPAAAQAALDAAVRALGPRDRWRILPRERTHAGRIDAALATLEGCVPALRARVLDACAACVAADGRTTPDEADLLRAVADALGCPLPAVPPPDAVVTVAAAGAAVAARR